MARIYDNIDISFKEGLQSLITTSGVKRLDLCVGYFNLRGWDLVDKQIDQLAGEEIYENDKKVFRTCRLLIGMHRPPEDLIQEFYSTTNYSPDSAYVQQCKLKIAADFRKQLTLGIPTKSDEETLRHLSIQMKTQKVCVKLYLKAPLHAKLYLAYRPNDSFNPIPAIMGSSNLTYSGLNREGELNAEFGDSDSAKKLSQWFCNRWEDKFCIDITNELIQIIDTSWASEIVLPPYYIYLKIAFLLSADAREGVNEFVLPQEFQNDLFDFQVTAVKIAAKHLWNQKKGGAMIGDVVGLGKTITACAIVKMLEMQQACSTLIICPANLIDMWKGYIIKYDLKADVMSMSKNIDYQNSKYYRLLVIDESQNLRNREGKHYQNIKKFIDYHDCKVLLLTATPYNKDYTDLSTQLSLFVSEDQDLGIRPEAFINSLGGERGYLQKYGDTFVRSIKAFEKGTFVDDWRELMRLFLVRRTRTFIKENYAKTDPSNGRKYLLFPNGNRSYFPDRNSKAIKFKTEEGDQFSRLYSEAMMSMMENLKLPRYGLMKYIDEKQEVQASPIEKQILENLSRAGTRIMGFCKSTFFKRMDSCGIAFLITLYRHILRNAIFVYAIDNKLALPIGDENALPDTFYEDEDGNLGLLGGENSIMKGITTNGDTVIFPTDMEIYASLAKAYYAMITTKNDSNISWLPFHFFKRSLKQELKKDCETIISMIKLCGEWNSATDGKLNELYRLLTDTHKDDKVIIFTQYSDTADYLFQQLKKKGITHIDCVTGESNNPTSSVINFSPISSNKVVPQEQQTCVMIATDVLSEGQNLQDSHVIINYDLPWAIIRLIQRAGRVDRIGQKSVKIDCYSFFPVDGIENIIQLRERLNRRINENAGIVGSDEIFFEGNEQNLRDLYNEKSGVLEEDDDNDKEVDLASQAFQIWKNATDANPKLKEIIPSLCSGIYSTKKNHGDLQDEGVITYAKTFNGNDVLTWINSNKEIVSQSQTNILNAIKCFSNEPAVKPLNQHHELVSYAIDEIKKVQKVKTSGILGSAFSTKRRIVNLLEAYINDSSNELFINDEIKNALDDIYNYALLENAKFTLGQLLKRNASVQDIIDCIIDLYNQNLLCHKEENENNKEPKLICSIGLRNL